MQSAARAIARIAAQRQQPWPRLQQCIWTQPVCSRVAVPLGAPSPRSSQRSAAALVLPGTATSATARFYSGAGGAGSAGRAGTSLARQIEEQEALLEKEAERLRMLQEVLEKEAGRLLMVEEALTKEGVPDTSPRWQILAADKQILAAKEQRLAAKEQDLAVDKQGLAADKQRFAEKEAAARNRFRVPRYKVTPVPIPGDDAPLAVLEFEQGASGHGDPPYIIDHGHMVSSLTAWVKMGSSTGAPTVCAINGLVKTGKTTALTKVLPQLVRTHFPKALFCHLDFNTFMRPGSSAEDIAAALLLRLETWAKANGFPLQPRERHYGYEGTKSNIYSLMDKFAHSDHKIYFLIDEVQRFFQTSNKPDRTLFKALLRLSDEGGRLYFAFTGSGMVRAWAEIAQCPANGTTVSASAWCVNLPATNPDAVLKYAADRLVVCVTKTAEHTVGDIEMAGLCEVLDTARSVAGQSYLAGLWRGAAHQAFAELTSSSLLRFLDQKTVKKLYENVTKAASDKYYDEFKTDMLPLLCTISTTDGHGDDSMLMEMRCLADRTATKPPESSTFKRLHTTFFQHYIDTIVDNEGKLTYGFPNTPFSTLIKEHVSVNGVLQEPSGHNLLRYTHNELAMYRLSELVGDRVKDANKVANKVVPPKSSSKFWGKVESITHDHFKEMNWLVDSKTPETHPGLKVFLSWCNDGVQKVIADHRNLGKVVPFPHCLYLYALRNAFTHTADNKKGVRSAQLKRQIMMEGPPWNLNELLRKLEAQLVDKEKKSKKGKKSKKKGEKRKADADADAEQKKAKKMKKEKKAKKSKKA